MIGSIPELTFLIAGISIAVALGSGASRRLLTNVKETKRLTAELSAYNKELREAAVKGDKTKEAKLKKRQTQMRQLQAKVARENMKPTFAFLIPLLLIWWIGLPALIGPDWISLTAASSPISLNVIPIFPITSEVVIEGKAIEHSISVFIWYLLASFSFQGIVSKTLKLT